MALGNASAAGESERRAHALDNPSADEAAWHQARAHARSRGEHDQAEQERPPRSDQVGESTTGDEKSAERKRVPVMIHCRLLAEDPKDDLTTGSAVVTIVTSRTTTNCATQVTARGNPIGPFFR